MRAALDKGLRFAVALTFALSIGVVSIEAATANPFGPAEGCCRFADGGTHKVFYENLRNEQIVASDHALNHVSATDAGPIEMHNQELAWTDVIVRDAWYGGWMTDNAGGWVCTVVRANGTCDKGVLMYNLGWLENWNGRAGVPYNANERAHIGCHEFGHSLGLDHATNDNSCMRAGRFEIHWYTWNHDRVHINGYYS